jgi:hypothetical protein
MTLLDPPVTPLAISLLGPFSLRVDGAPLPRLRSHRLESILALLTLRHDRPVDRTWLAGLLWPDSADSRGLATLRRYLTELRQVLGPEAQRLHSPTASSLRFDLEGATVDLIAFEAAIAWGLLPNTGAPSEAPGAPWGRKRSRPRGRRAGRCRWTRQLRPRLARPRRADGCPATSCSDIAGGDDVLDAGPLRRLHIWQRPVRRAGRAAAVRATPSSRLAPCRGHSSEQTPHRSRVA